MTKLKSYLIAFGIAVAAYFLGRQRGRDNEKIENLEKSGASLSAVQRARADLGDDDNVRRLRQKYARV